jgi:5-methylcytosine-specific restriction protein A
MNNMNSDFLMIKKTLEDAYDIPFEVQGGITYNDPWFSICPANKEKELFELKVTFKEHVRMIIEVQPQRYAAFSVVDMSKASEEKKKIFSEYAKIVVERRAKIDFYINSIIVNSTESETWPEEWENYKCRISRSPIIGENEEFNAGKITAEWAELITGMFLSLLNVITVEDCKSEYTEGKVEKVQVNKYERNPINRELCLAVNGYVCKICGFDFETIYGKMGYHFIHIHHIVPVSKMGGEYIIRPAVDLIPVCANCHAMLHRNDPPYLPVELKQIIDQEK